MSVVIQPSWLLNRIKVILLLLLCVVCRDQLLYAYDAVVHVDVLDSHDSANLELLGRPDLGMTFTKLQCWRLTQYTKCVFLDADTLVSYLIIISYCSSLNHRHRSLSVSVLHSELILCGFFHLAPKTLWVAVMDSGPVSDAPCFLGWLRSSVVRTSVSDRRTFPGLRLICSGCVTTYVGITSAIGQPTRPTQPFILLGSINK